MFSFFKKKPEIRGGAFADPILGGIPYTDDILGAPIEARPRKFSLRDKMPPAGRQMNWDCVGWAGAYLREYQEFIETGRQIDFSGMAIYTLAKKHDGYQAKGTYLHLGAYIPTKYGTVLEEDYPEQNISTDPQMPEISAKALLRGAQYKTKESVAVDVRGENYEGIKDTLARTRMPIIIGIMWRRYAQTERDGTLLMSGDEIFGHALLATGYDDDAGKLEVLDTKGREWGNEGYALIRYGTPLYATGWTSIDLPNDYKKPEVPKVQWKRDLSSEQRNASLLQSAIYQSFAPTDRARALAAKDWLVLIKMTTYLGYSFTDIVNDLYSRSRGKGPLWDQNQPRKYNN